MKSKLFTAVPLFLMTLPNVASATSVYLSPYFIHNRLFIEKEYTNKEDSVAASRNDPFGLLVGVNYQDVVMVEVGKYEQSGFLDDGEDFEVKFLMVGIPFKLGNRIVVVPKLGISDWRLDQKELFSDAPESSSSGEDLSLGITGEIPLLNWFSLYGSYSYMKPEFGTVNSTSIGIKFDLDL